MHIVCFVVEAQRCAAAGLGLGVARGGRCEATLRRVKPVWCAGVAVDALGFGGWGESRGEWWCGRRAQLAGRFGRLVVIGIDVTHSTTPWRQVRKEVKR